MRKEYLKETKKIEKIWEKTLKNRRKECGNNHKSIEWNLYIVTSNSDYLDKVTGICTYCLNYSERPLNKEELSEIDRFRENLRRPFDI